MSEYEPETFEPEPVEPGASDEIAPEAGEPRRRPWWMKVLIGLSVAVLTIVVAAVMLYNFGAMGSSANDPAMKQAYEQMVAAGQTPPVQKRFVIRIPGCTCHSTDPVQTEVHRYYRMRECMSCHGG